MTLEEAKTKIDELNALVAKQQKDLKTANDESAARRHDIKTLKDQMAAFESDGGKALKDASAKILELEGVLRERDARLRTHNLRTAFGLTASEMGLQFSSVKAQEDGFLLALPEMGSVEVEDGGKAGPGLRDAIKKGLEGREYLLTTNKAPDTDSSKRSSQQKPLTEEELMARKKRDIDYSPL